MKCKKLKIAIGLLLATFSLCCASIAGISFNNKEIIQVNAETTICYTYDKVSSGTLESGKYLIVCEEYNVAFNGALTTSTDFNSTNNKKEITITNGSIAIDDTTNSICFTYDSENKTLKSQDGHYIGSASESSNINADKKTILTNTITIDENGNADIVGSNGKYLRYNKSTPKFNYYSSSTYTRQQPVQIYKRNDTANAFATKFLKAFTCDSSGQSSPTFITNWSELSTLYGLLDDTEKTTLKNAIANENGITIEQAMARYDYVVNKYSYDNFIGRTISNYEGINNAFKADLSTGESNNTSFTLIIVILALIALFGCILYRKKKHE